MWKDSKKTVPEEGQVVLVLGPLHFGQALAIHRDGQWHIQPYKARWFKTTTGVVHWHALPDGYLVQPDREDGG